MMRPHNLTNEDLRKLHAAGVKREDILDYFGLTSLESLRKRERRIGLPQRRRGWKPEAPKVWEVLDVPKDTRAEKLRPLSSQEVRVRIITSMKAGKIYRSAELADRTGVSINRIKSNMAFLVRMRLISSVSTGRNKDTACYRLNLDKDGAADLRSRARLSRPDQRVKSGGEQSVPV